MLFYNIKRSLCPSITNYVRRTATQSYLAAPQTPRSKEPNLENILKLPVYTEMQRMQILQIINENDAQQLLSYDITKTRANKLHNWKARNGPLRELSDIFYVEGFALKMVTRFYQSLLEPATSRASTSKPNTRTAPFITPTLDAEQRQRISSSIALRIGVSSVTWARLELTEGEDKPCMLTDWQHHELNEKKLHLAQLAQRCLYVVHQIPAADCYIMENPQMAQASSNPGSIDQQNVNIQRAQVIAMLSYALMARANHGQLKTNLYYMRRLLSARLFNHQVGTERVSSEDTVIAMMRTFYNFAEQQEQFAEEACTQRDTSRFRGQVQFPQQLRDMYAQAERHQRELLGQAFLLNLAFVRLILLQDEASIASVSRSSKKLHSDTELA